jgi:hypothetical protein
MFADECVLICWWHPLTWAWNAIDSLDHLLWSAHMLGNVSHTEFTYERERERELIHAATNFASHHLLAMFRTADQPTHLSLSFTRM